MRITITLKAFYDWEQRDAVPESADLQALQAKAGTDGKWLWKVVKPCATFTDIGLPESEIVDCTAHFARLGVTKSRAAIAAWYLEEKVMPHHAHVDDFVRVTVEGEPAVEAFLNSYFGCDEQQAAS